MLTMAPQENGMTILDAPRHYQRNCCFGLLQLQTPYKFQGFMPRNGADDNLQLGRVARAWTWQRGLPLATTYMLHKTAMTTEEMTLAANRKEMSLGRCENLPQQVKIRPTSALRSATSF